MIEHGETVTGPASRRESITRRLAVAFAAAGEELYLVGGAVRDELLNEQGTDLDFATSAVPASSAAVLESMNIGSPYRAGERYGTVALVLDGLTIEVTTYRSEEVYPAASRKPVVRFGQSLYEDLQRRDFTVNAMALNPLTGELIDPFNGQADLRTRKICAVGAPAERFHEDPLRLLRAVRFATRLGFTIDSETWQAMLETSKTLATISSERIRDEFSNILTGPHPAIGMTALRDSNLLAAATSKLLELTAMPDHGPRHPLSLWDHTMRVLSGVPPNLTLRWAALLHDIAKPRTRTHEADGRPRFFHHEELGAAMGRDLLRSLRYPNALIADVSLLVGSHMQIHAYGSEWTDGAVRRLMLRLGPLLPAAIALARADAAGHTLDGRAENAPRYDELEQRVSALLQGPVDTLRSPLSGTDLMERYDAPPGPWIGRIKEALQDAVIEGSLKVGDREGAWEIADRMRNTGP